MRLHPLAVLVLIGGYVNQPGARAEETLPKILIIGDSISIGYTKPLVEILKDEAVVEHNPGNAAHSANGFAKLDKWLGETKWDVIHFNHGLHDLKWVDEKGKSTESKAGGHIQIAVEDYEKNLEAIVRRLKKTGARLIFATTTPFPEKVDGPLREVEQVAVYNEAALRVMKKHDIAIDDLHGFASSRLAEIQRPHNVHFAAEGSQELAEEVARHIRKFLAERGARDSAK